MPVMHRPDETRRTLLVDWLASIGLNANDIPADYGALTVTRDSLGALHVHWLEIVYDDGKPVIDATMQRALAKRAGYGAKVVAASVTEATVEVWEVRRVPPAGDLVRSVSNVCAESVPMASAVGALTRMLSSRLLLGICGQQKTLDSRS